MPRSSSRERSGATSWRIWVDTGGTFTDCLAVSPDGASLRVKVLSTAAMRGQLEPFESGCEGVFTPAMQPLGGGHRLPDDFFRGCELSLLSGGADAATVERYEAANGRLTWDRSLALRQTTFCEVRWPGEAPVLAAHVVTGTPLGVPLPQVDMRLATTKGTNALLERNGARVCFFVTRGFRDLLQIRDQRRPDLFELAIVKPAPLYASVEEVDGRLDAQGEVLEPLVLEQIECAARRQLAQGVRVAAVALVNGYRRPEEEQIVAARLRTVGFDHVSTSCELSDRIELLARAETAVVDAYLEPVLRSYLEDVRGAVSGGSLRVLTSAGGLKSAETYRAKDSLLSGPAGGVVGATAVAARSGSERLIAFDMGGTSTDVTRVDGTPELRQVLEVGGSKLLSPALDICTVAAGGGSLCLHDGFELRVGPESGGAAPGPACYGLGGELTITDVNLLLGRVDPSQFGIPIEPVAALEAFDRLCRSVGVGDDAASRVALAEGLVQLADERMAGAIRTVSTRRGYDPKEYVLVAFGGAGGQHACAVAEVLGMEHVWVPAAAGVLSAYGLGRARLEALESLQLLRPLADAVGELGGWFLELDRLARESLVRDGAKADALTGVRRVVRLRRPGQSDSIDVDWQSEDGHESLYAVFSDRYRTLFGYPPPDDRCEIESIEVLVAEVTEPSESEPESGSSTKSSAARSVRSQLDPERVYSVFDRAALSHSVAIEGPALLVDPHSTTVVGAGWTAQLDRFSTLKCTRRPEPESESANRPKMAFSDLAPKASVEEERGSRT